MNIILSSVSFRNFWPNTWFTSPQVEMCEYVGNRTGTLSLVNMSIAILFAGRNNLLINVTGWSQTAFLTLHRWAARVAALQAVVHSIAYTVAYFEPGGGAATYAAKAAEPFYWWGIIATIALCLATAFAILPLRIHFYEIFLIAHIALVILALIGCWYHLVPHFGYIYGYQVWLYICFAFWAFDRVARVARVVYYNRLGRSMAVVEEVKGCDIMQITVFPRVAWVFGPGQHSFLYLPGLQGKFWESHPFSIAGWKTGDERSPPSPTASTPTSNVGKGEGEKESGVVSLATLPHRTQTQERRPSIKFLIRAHSGMTSTLHHRLLSSPSHSMEISLYTEGPYAGHQATLQPLFLADTVLCLVGGIGITNALGFVQEYASRVRGEVGDESRSGRNSGSRGVMKKAKRFILAWSAREMGLIEHVKRNFLLDVDGIEYSFFCTGDSSSSSPLSSDTPNLDTYPSNDESQKDESLTIGTATLTRGRMDIGTVIRSSLEAGLQTTVLVCGPGNMADEATKEVVGCVKEGWSVDLVEEAFAW
ncbi:hypothetical protein BDZ45DRAFT_681442 [Acephala macrosclerotiorum]|nr:hypothetical protein BDZ45DRAFT_681442 [Acephala macrosclerotiorum]